MLRFARKQRFGQWIFKKNPEIYNSSSKNDPLFLLNENFQELIGHKMIHFEMLSGNITQKIFGNASIDQTNIFLRKLIKLRKYFYKGSHFSDPFQISKIIFTTFLSEHRSRQK